MINELQANEGKGKWDNLHPLYLCAELHYHASKLYKACDENDKQKILEYSADCGNIAMMIADVTTSLNLLNMPRVSNNEGLEPSEGVEFTCKNCGGHTKIFRKSTGKYSCGDCAFICK